MSDLWLTGTRWAVGQRVRTAITQDGHHVTATAKARSSDSPAVPPETSPLILRSPSPQ
jgi:hypothetical protein